MLTLTQQQARVFDLFVKQRNNMKEIALTLGVSYSRIINILNEILIKTGFKSRNELLIKGVDLEFEVK
mgnify:CR=1 FL=1